MADPAPVLLRLKQHGQRAADLRIEKRASRLVRDGDEILQMFCVHLALLRLSVIQITLIAITNNFTFILPC